MLTPTNVTVSQYNAAVKADAYTHIRLTFTDQNIVFTDSDFEQNGVVISHILNGDTDLTIGRAVMSSITAYLFMSDKVKNLIWENECKLEIGIDVSGNTEWVTIGYYTGERPEKINANNIVEFVAYDRMKKFDTVCKDWLENLTYPMDVQDLYDSLCTYVGVENVAGDELPDIMDRSYTATPIANGGLLCRDILAMIAEAAGCYARIDHNGKVKLVWYEDHTDYVLTGDDEFRVDSLGLNFTADSKTWEDLEDYTWEELEQLTWADIEDYHKQLQIKYLTVKQTEDDIGVTVPSSANGTHYLIVDNPFLTVDTDADIAAYITPIYTRLHDFGGYLPMSVSCVGNPLVEVGDIITAEVKGEIVALPIFVKNMRCTSACTDAYEATGSLQREEVSPANREKLSQGGKFHIFRNDLNELYSELYDPITGDVSVLQQTATALGLSAAGIDIVGGKYVKIESGGTFDVDSTNFKISSSDATIDIGSWHFTQSWINHHNTQNGGYFYLLPGFVPTYPTIDKSINMGYSFINADFGHIDFVFGFHNDNTTWDVNKMYSYVHFDRATDGTTHMVFEKKDIDNPTVGYGGEKGVIEGLEKIISAGSDGSGYTLNIEEGLYIQTYGNSKNITVNPYDGIIYNGYNANAFTVDPWGNVVCQTCSPRSSREVKHDIEDLKDVSKQIDNLNPVKFAYNNDKDGRKHFGLIYEDTIDIIPEICMESEQGVKGINYTELIPILLKEIQDLRKRVAILEGR